MQCPYVSCQKCSLKIEIGTKRNKVCVLKCHKKSTLDLTYVHANLCFYDLKIPDKNLPIYSLTLASASFPMQEDRL